MTTAPLTPADVTAAGTLRLLTVPDAHAVTGITERTLRYLITKRAIPVVRIGRSVYLRLADLETWVAENTTPVGGAR